MTKSTGKSNPVVSATYTTVFGGFLSIPSGLNLGVITAFGRADPAPSVREPSIHISGYPSEPPDMIDILFAAWPIGSSELSPLGLLAFIVAVIAIFAIAAQIGKYILPKRA